MKELMTFQKEALSAISNHNYALLALDMGLGKTFTSLKWLENKTDIPTIILVQSSKLKDWEREVGELYDSEEIVILKTVATAYEFFKKIQNNFKKIIILSYNIFVALNNKDRKLFDNLKLEWNLIIDESQVLKNHSSKISKSCLKLQKHLKHLLLLTGDPISSGYKDLFVQMKMLKCFENDEYKWSEFVNDFCITRILSGTSIPLITGYKNTEYLLDLLKKKSFFLKTEQALKLPTKQFIDMIIPRSEYYLEMKNEKILKIENELIVADSSLKLLTSLRQINSDFIYNEGNKIPLNETKKEFVSKIINDGNWIIFYNFNAELDSIVELAKEKNKKLIQINGLKNDFDPNVNYSNSIVAIQYSSGARGIDGLQKCFNKTIYWSPTLSGEMFRQSIKRTHRIGQEKDCVYYLLKVEKTIDDKIYKCLNQSKEYSLKMFEKDIKEN